MTVRPARYREQRARLRTNPDHYPAHLMHEDAFSGRVTYLGTGIANLDAAKRYLRARWRQAPLPRIERRAGARFYVSVRGGRRARMLLGPYVSHMTALAAVPRARRLLAERYPDASVSVGTASMPNTVPTLFGR